MQIFIYFFLCFGDRVVPPSIDRFWRPLLGLYINIDTVLRSRVCVCVCPQAYDGWMEQGLTSHSTQNMSFRRRSSQPISWLAGSRPTLQSSRNFCACYSCPWLGPALSALQYVMYFRLYWWRHICTGHMDRHTDTVPTGDVIASSCTG